MSNLDTASKIWERKGRGYWTTISKRQHFLGHDLAKAKRRFRELQLSAPITTTTRHSLQDLIVLYLRDAKTRLKPRSFSNCKDYLERWLGEYQDVRSAELRAYHIREWLSKHPTWNATTRKHAGAIIKGWSKWCEAEGLLDIDRLRSAKLPTALTREAADPADLIRLEKAIRDDAFRDFYVVLYDTGARPGEIAGLTADRVSIATSTALVHGKKRDRVIGLTPRALEIVRRLALARPEGLLFLTRTGSRWSQQRQKDAFDRWQIVAGCVGRVVPYSLRHDLYRRWTARGGSASL